MGIFDEFKRLAHPYEDEDEGDLDDFEPAPRASDRRSRADRDDRLDRSDRSDRPERVARGDNYGVSAEESERRGNKVVNIRAATQLQVVLVKPERFEEAASIGDNLNAKRTVVLNLESTNRDIARRLLDFLSGVAYANNGQIKRVANSTYIITPYNVDVMGDLIDELENNGMFM